MGETLRELERVRDKGFKILKENLTPVELIEFLQIISNGTGDYTKEKYESDEELTIEDFEKFLAEKKSLCEYYKPFLREFHRELSSPVQSERRTHPLMRRHRDRKLQTSEVFCGRQRMVGDVRYAERQARNDECHRFRRILLTSLPE